MAPWREIKEREPGESTATHKNTERRRNSDSSLYEVGDTILQPSEDFWSCSIFQLQSTWDKFSGRDNINLLYQSGVCEERRIKKSVIIGSVLDFHYGCSSTDEQHMTLFSQYIRLVVRYIVIMFVCVGGWRCVRSYRLTRRVSLCRSYPPPHLSSKGGCD